MASLNAPIFESNVGAAVSYLPLSDCLLLSPCYPLRSASTSLSVFLSLSLALRLSLRLRCSDAPIFKRGAIWGIIVFYATLKTDEWRRLFGTTLTAVHNPPGGEFLRGFTRGGARGPDFSSELDGRAKMIRHGGSSRSLLMICVGCTLAMFSMALGNTRSSRRRPIERKIRAGSAQPTAVATWRFGKIAVDAAAAVLEDGGTALDATEAGVTAVEMDTKDQYYVGKGGLPNSDGVMEFDAAVMEGTTVSYGAVLAVRGIVKAFRCARLVMERSPHSVLVGEGATSFALCNGIEAADTLTDDARQQFEEWTIQHREEAEATRAHADREESHDTVGVICLDDKGNLCAGTSTSGWKFKHPGRVGDAPVVGSGLYCDSQVGGAVATGDGEEILRTCLSFYVVERMREGDSPGLACKKGIARLEKIVSRPAAVATTDTDIARMHKKLTVAVMALSPTGEIGAASTLGPENVHRGRPAFPLAVWKKGEAVRVVEETDFQS